MYICFVKYMCLLMKRVHWHLCDEFPFHFFPVSTSFAHFVPSFTFVSHRIASQFRTSMYERSTIQAYNETYRFLVNSAETQVMEFEISFKNLLIFPCHCRRCCCCYQIEYNYFYKKLATK